MIILDTSILRSISPESSSANLLHAISVAAHETIAMPWMVREELAAQQAIKYESVHTKAVAALEALRQTAPWDFTPELSASESDLHRDYWRRRWTPPLEVIPTSEEALREGMYREANLLPPCRLAKDIKTGARDTAIWMSAVEYAREHLDETVFFVSANTKDFGDGTNPLPFPMDQDIAGMEDRFRILTSIADLAADFTEPTEVSREEAEAVLNTPSAHAFIHYDSTRRLASVPFAATIALSEDRTIVDDVIEWRTGSAFIDTIDDLQGYRIGQQRWCAANVVWDIAGSFESQFGFVVGAISWSTTVLFSLDSDRN